jgi:hydrogenase/urease accessory protein HupE
LDLCRRGHRPDPSARTGSGRDSSAVSLRQFVRFGFLHILPKGLDHVLFVLGLYLGARSLRSLLILVTCFTLAHSITLGLASIGIISLSPSIVEPLISASIAWVGMENFFPSARTERYRPLLVFGFGLLHGLGFASALSALDAPQGLFLPSLLSFNLGIELGQLTVIAGALLLTMWCRQRSWYRRVIALPACAIIALIAAVWTVQRLSI